MNNKTKGIFEALPNCLTLQEIINYLDSRNYDERKKKEEYNEMYEDGSLILNNDIEINCEEKDRVQIIYREFRRSPRSPIITKEYMLHQPSWLIVPTTCFNDVWVKGMINCYYTEKDEIINEPFLGQTKVKKKIKRTYYGSVHCPYTELSFDKLESMLKESLKKITHIIDEVRYDKIETINGSLNSLPIIMND